MMIEMQINNTCYATNSNLSGFFSRREHDGAYKQHFGNLDIGFANEREFEKFSRAWHKSETARQNYEWLGREPGVTRTGRFVWRAI